MIDIDVDFYRAELERKVTDTLVLWLERASKNECEPWQAYDAIDVLWQATAGLIPVPLQRQLEEAMDVLRKEPSQFHLAKVLARDDRVAAVLVDRHGKVKVAISGRTSCFDFTDEASPALVARQRAAAAVKELTRRRFQEV